MSDTNGAITKERIADALPTPAPASFLWFAYLQAFVAFAMLGTAVYMTMLVSELRRAQVQITADREEDAKRAKLLDDARDKQVIQAAELLVKQKENIRLAKDLNQQLRGN
jgi:hypothetical protein